MEQKSEIKTSYIFLIILGLIALAILVGVLYSWEKKREVSIPSVTPEESGEKIAPVEDTVLSVNEDLEKIEFPNLDQAFQEIDQELNSL